MVHLARLEQTCFFCPSQWDGWEADGTYWYIRYRGGWLSVDRADSKAAFLDGTGHVDEDVFTLAHGGQHDGVMTTAEMLNLTGFTHDPAGAR